MEKLFRPESKIQLIDFYGIKSPHEPFFDIERHGLLYGLFSGMIKTGDFKPVFGSWEKRDGISFDVNPSLDDTLRYSSSNQPMHEGNGFDDIYHEELSAMSGFSQGELERMRARFSPLVAKFDSLKAGNPRGVASNVRVKEMLALAERQGAGYYEAATRGRV